MKDIDFDELDRAVSSVLGQKVPAESAEQSESVVSVAVEPKKPQPSTAEPATSISSFVKDLEKDDAQNASSNVPASSEPSPVSAPVVAPVSAVSPAPAPQAPLAVKRRGKFMDMVHPSADMATQKPMTARPRPFSRHETPDITPTAKENERNSDSVESPVVQPVSETVDEPIAAVDESQALIGAEPISFEDGSHTLPAETLDAPEKQNIPNLDPLASFVPPEDESTETVAALSNSADKEHDNKTDDVAADVSEEETVSSDAAFSTSLQATPFLSDTKVEKRPLGGFSGAESVPVADPQQAPTVPLPRELQSDVMKVESDQPEMTTGVASSASSPFATTVEAAPEPANDDRVEGHPLFDTSTYHEPIAAVSRGKTPAWLKWMLGLLVCLAIGAGVGYFLFTAGL